MTQIKLQTALLPGRALALPQLLVYQQVEGKKEPLK